MKRLLDLVVAAVALVLLSPVLVMAALAVLVDSGRPVLFLQERIGLQGRPFRMAKFRSMVRDAASRGPFNTQAGDPRITRVGRVLRRTSIDELPQLLNVLAGDMSLVGPRPDLPQQRSLYTDEQFALRQSVRPGITGLAQSTLRSEATEQQRRDLDLRYARERSFAGDIEILAHTMGRLTGRGGN